MHVNEVRDSTDHDFKHFYSIVSGSEGWSTSYNKGNVTVETKWTDQSRVKMIKVTAPLDGVSLDCLYDVLHDPDYRKVWDKDMTDSYDICKVGDNSVIGWYGAKMPAPLKYRDWCTLRTWKKTDEEFMIFNHSIEHKLIPIRKNYVRSISYMTGYYGKKLTSNSCSVVFLTQTDPKGKLPSWFVNFISTKMSPRIAKKIRKTALDYDKWKKKNNPSHKPWLDPTLTNLPPLNPDDVISVASDDSDAKSDELDETNAEQPTDAIDDES